MLGLVALRDGTIRNPQATKSCARGRHRGWRRTGLGIDTFAVVSLVE